MTRYIVEARDRFGAWSAAAAGPHECRFASEAEALAAADELTTALPSDRADLRILPVAERWQLVEEGTHYDDVECESAEQALEIARENVDAALYDAERLPMRIRVAVRDEDGEEVACDYVILDAIEPECPGRADDDQDDTDHQWSDSKPYGAAAGMVAQVSTCARCGLHRIDGPVLDGSNGEYFRATQYRRADA